MDVNGIKNTITEIAENPSEYGFEVFIVSKVEPCLSRINFLDSKKDGNDLRNKLKNNMIDVLQEKYTDEDVEYVLADRMADNQEKCYVIMTGESYDPFSFLRVGTVPEFSSNNIASASGVVFCFRNGEHKVWAYQHLWPMMTPNKTKKGTLGHFVSGERTDVFVEIEGPVLTFSKKIDLLIFEDCIVTMNFKLLQSQFGFQEYIRDRANVAICAVDAAGIVANVEKLYEYVGRGNQRYAKKMMRIADSKVLTVPYEELVDRVQQSDRWNGKLTFSDGKITLSTYSEVEALIDLLDERYTRSDITGAEYDTAVKTLA